MSFQIEIVFLGWSRINKNIWLKYGNKIVDY